MELTLRTAYWDDPKARDAFQAFMLEIHGLDFSEWKSAGYWDEAYTPFSFFAGNRVIASVCVYLLDAIIDGEATRVAQISGVGTLPGWRRRGLNRQLTDIGLDWAKGKQTGIFLFANTEAIPFYERCGFEQIEECLEVVAATPAPNHGGIVKLDPGKPRDRDRIFDYARRRAPVSDRFAVLNAKLAMFHALYSLRDHAYEIPDLDCVVFHKRGDRCASFLDVLAEQVPRFDQLYPYFAHEQDQVIELHFGGDKLGLDGSRTEALLGNNPFVRGSFPVERPVFPFTSRA